MSTSRWFAMLVMAWAIVASPAMVASADELSDQRIDEFAGLCVLVGTHDDITERLATNPNVVTHCLDPSETNAVRLQSQMASSDPAGTLVVERWRSSKLPHADNIVNVLIVDEDARTTLNQSEVLRVVCPGGVVYFRDGESCRSVTKPWPEGMDEWTHQWHASDGGLVSDDKHIGVPQGIQWLSGPLFAMAGRKSSTQTLVTAGGRNFYVTQNVSKNVGRPEMAQYLVARDAFNGLLLWQRPWTGPFVTGNGETNPRMVASADRLYVTNSDGVMALDARTGDEVARFDFESPADKLVLVDSQLLIQTLEGVTAIDVDLGSVRWTFRDQTTSNLVVSDRKVLLLVSGRSADGAFQHALVCLDILSGVPAWRTNTQPQTATVRVRIGFAEDGFVGLQSHGSFHMFSSKSGEHLWSQTTDARPGKSYVDERYVGHFYRHGLLWMLAENSLRELDGQNVWLGLNPQSGELERELSTRGEWPETSTPAKMGCQVLIASDRFLMIPRQATFVDFETGEKHPFKFTRGGCGLGFVPANGLVYSHPHACGCFSEAIRGFMGMHSSEPPEFQPAGADRLEIGPAYGVTSTSAADSEDWPTYRRDGRRSGFSPTALGGSLKRRWSTRVAPVRNTISARAWHLRTGNILSAPTVADGTVFVADVDQGIVVATDTTDGAVRWRFQADGRIDTPPTLHNGLCLFGAHDGYLYALDAEDGRLAWTYRAAPIDRRIIAFGSLESVWPVAGTVLVRNSHAFVAAGRAPDADGGIEVHALDVMSGEPTWSTRVDGEGFRGICDYLVEGDDGIFLSNRRFDPATGDQTEPNDSSRHLRGGKVGLLEASWTRHDLALRKDMQTWTANNASGQLLAFSPGGAASYRAEARELSFDGDEQWTVAIAEPAQVTALAITNTHVVAAVDTSRNVDLAEGELWLVDRRTGHRTATAHLPADPVFDGIAIARGQLFVTTQDGQLNCFGPSDD